MKGLRKLTAIAMALFLAASLVSFSWSAPQAHFQRRDWTPQAMLYLKGAQGRRFISDESQRNDPYDRMKLETHSQNTNPLSLSEAAALFLSSLQKAQEEVVFSCLCCCSRRGSGSNSPLRKKGITRQSNLVEEENSDRPAYLTDKLSNW